MTQAERIRTAYALTDQAATTLMQGNDPATGYRLLVRAAAVGLAGVAGNAQSVEHLNALARELEALGG